jgi:hypothetical protein
MKQMAEPKFTYLETDVKDIQAPTKEPNYYGHGLPCLELGTQDLEDLTNLLGRNIDSVDGLLAAAKAVTTLSVDGIDITLDSYLLNRLKSRCHPTQDFPQFVRDRVKELLSGYAGC